MRGEVQGKVALMPGDASGIGAACAELLTGEGASVAVTDIDELCHSGARRSLEPGI